MNCSFIAHGKVYYSDEENLSADDIQKQSDLFMKERLPNNIQLVETKSVRDDINANITTPAEVDHDKKGHDFIIVSGLCVAFLGISISCFVSNQRYKRESWKRYDNGSSKSKLKYIPTAVLLSKNDQFGETPSELSTPQSSPLRVSKYSQSEKLIQETDRGAIVMPDRNLEFPIKMSYEVMEESSLSNSSNMDDYNDQYNHCYEDKFKRTICL